MSDPPPEIVLFPRASFLDGGLTAREERALDLALEKYARADPAGLSRTLDRLHGFLPAEAYELTASVCEQAVLMMYPAYERGRAAPWAEFKKFVEAVWGTGLGAWAQAKKSKSVLGNL